jgi:hypothetical protein
MRALRFIDTEDRRRAELNEGLNATAIVARVINKTPMSLMVQRAVRAGGSRQKGASSEWRDQRSIEVLSFFFSTATAGQGQVGTGISEIKKTILRLF